MVKCRWREGWDWKSIGKRCEGKMIHGREHLSSHCDWHATKLEVKSMDAPLVSIEKYLQVFRFLAMTSIPRQKWFAFFLYASYSTAMSNIWPWDRMCKIESKHIGSFDNIKCLEKPVLCAVVIRTEYNFPVPSAHDLGNVTVTQNQTGSLKVSLAA